MTFKSTGKWRVVGLSADIDEAHFVDQGPDRRRKLRSFAKRLSELAAKAIMSGTPEEADDSLMTFTETLERACERAGEVLRLMDQDNV